MAVRVSRQANSSSMRMGAENSFMNPYPIEVDDDDEEEIAVIGVQNGTGAPPRSANSLKMNFHPRGSRSSSSSICPLAYTQDTFSLSSDNCYSNRISRTMERRKMNGFPSRREDKNMPRQSEKCVAPITNPRSEIDILLGDDIKKDEVEIISEVYPTVHSFHPTRKIRLLSDSNVSENGRTRYRDDSFSNRPCSPYLWKSYTANEVFRLQEKAQYKLLLEKVVKRPPLYQPAFHKENSQTSTIQVDLTEDDDVSNTRCHFKKEKVEENVKDFLSKYYKPCALVPYFDKKNSQLNHTQSVSEKESSDEEIQVIEYSELPKWKPRKTSMKCAGLFSDAWIADLKTSMIEKTEKTLQHVYENEKKVHRFKARREAKTAEEMRRREEQRLAGFIFPEDVDMEVEVLPEITPEMDAIIDRAFAPAPLDEKLSILEVRETLEIARNDVATLAHLNWLNDQVINFYLGLIERRSKLDGYPTVFCFNSFFYSKLKKEGASRPLLRWTRKTDIFANDLIIVPLHLEMHWALLVVDQRCKKLSYYDSMGNGEGACLKIVEDYLIAEMKDKKKTAMQPNTYSYEIVKDIPKQMNGSDCGMFTLKYAEYISRDAPITFTQEHMPYFRRRMVYELIAKQIL
ncbi:sentrin-specific protease 1 isoform X2 [Parasteatoda tepidariorum]|nr:sentrin-specific protease 1 isoform X2 [Parasteatoda tepidariorum]